MFCQYWVLVSIVDTLYNLCEVCRLKSFESVFSMQCVCIMIPVHFLANYTNLIRNKDYYAGIGQAPLAKIC